MDDFNLDNNEHGSNDSKQSYTYNENRYGYNYNTDYGTASSPLRDTSYYSESYKKPHKKGVGFVQLIVVALISSILGGTVVGGFFQFVVPSMSPSVRNYFSSIIPGAKPTTNNAGQNNNTGTSKVVEIVQNGDSPVAAIAEKVGPSVVGIKVTAKVSNFFFGEQEAQPQGSGIIIRSDGYIMTNNHVVSDALGNRGNSLNNGAKIEVILPSQKDKTYSAQVVGRDSKTDLAVLKIDATGLPAIEMGDSDKLKVGELVVAIGNPGGLEFMGSVTQGVVSGLNRSIPIEDGKDLKLIQTDAAINPGNSGGALVNSKGQLIGINTAKISASGFEGLGFAIPVNKAKEITDNLIQYTYVKGRPLLGITVDQRFTKDVADQYNVPMGVLVSDVSPFSGAYKAGIQAGDIITKFDGKEVKSFAELEDEKSKHKPDDVVTVEFYRDGQTKTVKVTLTEDKGK